MRVLAGVFVIGLIGAVAVAVTSGSQAPRKVLRRKALLRKELRLMPRPGEAAGVLRRKVRPIQVAPQPITLAKVNDWKKEFSNWSRWGKDDERGALNLITPAKQRQAANLVKDGVSVSLARLSNYELDAETHQGVPGTGPYVQRMASAGIDWFELKYHGYAHTHFDALGHVFENGVSYNGITNDKEKVMKEGLARGSVLVARKGVMTRGILIDVPRLRGVPYLEIGERVKGPDRA